MSKREEFIRQVMAFAAELADYYDCTDFAVGEDRQKGVWGEDGGCGLLTYLVTAWNTREGQ